MVWRPNPEALGTGAAVRAFLDEGPCTVLLDELDMVAEDVRLECGFGISGTSSAPRIR
jgi:hypothetical protein